MENTQEKMQENSQINPQKPKKNLNSSTYNLLACHGLNLAVAVFVSTFLVSHIYSYSSNYLVDIGLFYVFNYLAMGILYPIVSYFLDRTNRVSIYRFAIVIRGAFIVSLVFFGNEIAKFVILAGVLHGMSEAFYWTSYNVMKSELVSCCLTNKYSTIQVVENKLINFIVPIVLGGVIDSSSFIISSFIIFAVVIVQLIISIFIKSRRPLNSSFDMKKFVKDIKASPQRKDIYKTIFIISMINGFHAVVSSLNTILIMLVFKSNFSLGVLTGIFSGISILILLFIKRFVKTGKRLPLYISLVILSIISMTIVPFFMSKTLVVIYNFIYMFAAIVYSYMFDFYRNCFVKKFDMYDDIAEYQCIIESILQIARVFIYAIMIGVGLIGASFGANGLLFTLKIFFAACSIIYVFYNIMLYVCEKKFIKYKILE